MPYLSLRTSQKITDEKKHTVVSALGKLISIIPGKTENDLIVDLSSGLEMFIAGNRAPSAYIDIRIYTKAPEDAKSSFTREVIALVSRELNIKNEAIYMTVSEFDHWGYDGAYH